VGGMVKVGIGEEKTRKGRGFGPSGVSFGGMGGQRDNFWKR